MNEERKGYVYAVLAFLFWGGIAPIYFKLVAIVNPLEVLMHRVVWSFLLLLPLLLLTKQWQDFLHTFKDFKTVKRLFFSTFFVAINWLVFIWAVANDQLLEASLGYYINPLVNAFLGFIIFNERMSRNQYIAIVIALLAVLYQLYSLGSLPMVSLVLAFSFGLYGMIRKKVNMGSIVGLSVETFILLPFALIYLVYLIQNDSLAFINESSNISWLLALGGMVTITPLLLFNGAATRMKLTTLGFFQYIGPTMAFLLAIFVYNEPFNQEKLVTFILIWIALVIFSLDALLKKRK